MNTKASQNLILIFASLFCALIAVGVQLGGAPLWRGDRFLHLMLTAGLLYFVLAVQQPQRRSYVHAILLVLGIGLLKELFDPQLEHFDLVADALGIGLGLGAFQVFHARHEKRLMYSQR